MTSATAFFERLKNVANVTDFTLKPGFKTLISRFYFCHYRACPTWD